MIQPSTLLNVLHVPADDSKYTMKAALPGVIGCVKCAQTFNELEKNQKLSQKKKKEGEGREAKLGQCVYQKKPLQIS